jgi:hypothetical protein
MGRALMINVVAAAQTCAGEATRVANRQGR